VNQQVVGNTFAGKINAGSYDFTGTHGLWKDNVYTDSAGAASDLSVLGGPLYPHHDFVYAYQPASAVGAYTTIANGSQFADGQLVEIRAIGTSAVLLTASGSGHQFPAARLAVQGVSFVVRNQGGTWVLERYVLASTGRAPESQQIAPPYQTVESEAPAFQMWGMRLLRVAPSVATDFNGVLNPPGDDVPFTVVFNANTRIRHNTGALTIKLQLAGSVDYLPAGAGEIQFVKPAGQNVAIEIAGSRREGAASSAVLLATVAPADVTKAAASVGTSLYAARLDHKHDISTAPPVDIGTANAESATTTLARAGHVHSLPFAVVQTVLGAATADISVNSHKLIAVQDPTNPQDAATKAYVDAVATGLSPRQAALVLSTGNVASLTGLATTIDGIAVNTDGMRVVLAGQLTPVENGLWVAHAGAWTRPADFAVGSHVAGAFVFIEEGTVNQDSGWVVTTDPPNDVVGTNSLALTQFSGAGQITAGAGLTKTGNTIDVASNDGSIAVNPNDIRVSLTVQLGAAAGATAVQPARQVIAGNGLTGGGDLTADRTFDVVANADGSIVVAANDVKVGVLATDVQHGVRGGGTQHALAVAGGAAGFQSGADKAKVDVFSVTSSGDAGLTDAGGTAATTPNGNVIQITPGDAGQLASGTLKPDKEYLSEVRFQTVGASASGFGYDLFNAGDGLYTFELRVHANCHATHESGHMFRRTHYRIEGLTLAGVGLETTSNIGTGVGGTVINEGIAGSAVLFTWTPIPGETRTIDYVLRLWVYRSTGL
jgi:hypothetical protein